MIFILCLSYNTYTERRALTMPTKSLLGVLKINADFLHSEKICRECWLFLLVLRPQFYSNLNKKVTNVTNYYAEFVMLAMLSVENQRIYLLSEVRISLSKNQAAEGSNQFICWAEWKFRCRKTGRWKETSNLFAELSQYFVVLTVGKTGGGSKQSIYLLS